MPLSKTVRDIKSLRIQGAEAISKSALKTLDEVVHSTKAETKLKLLRALAQAKASLEKARPTEPCMRNALKYVFGHSQGASVSELRESFLRNIQKVLIELKEAESAIRKIGALKIRNGMTVFTHCHSSTVTGILIAANEQGKRFEVHNTETRPHFQGRITATELGKKGIKVVHFIDAAARFAMKKADLMLIGCDAFTSEGRIINKIGSELFAEVAHKMEIPIYVCSTSWKFDPETVFGFEETIESRARKEVWNNPPRNVKVDTHIFEIIDPALITAMITEIGVYRPSVLVQELKARNPWMFRD